MVMSVATKHIHPSMPARRKTTKASGTNVMSATSLVTAMLAKNASPTNTPATARCVRARATNHAPAASSTPSERNPATTAIRQNSSANVCQSTYGGIPGRRRHKDARRQGCRNSNDYHGLTRRKSPKSTHRRPKRYLFRPNHKMQGYHVAFERNGKPPAALSRFRQLFAD